jgi:polar amino acid transport system ATP-binding protein
MPKICVTHEMRFAREVAGRVWFLDGDRVLERAKPDQFFNAPQRPSAQKFVSDIRHWALAS